MKRVIQGGVVLIIGFLVWNGGIFTGLFGEVGEVGGALVSRLQGDTTATAYTIGKSRAVASPERIKGPFYYVVKVTDGDTYDLASPDGGTVTVRLIGIDTPETFDSDKLAEQAAFWGVSPERVQAHGRRAKRQARKLLNGRTVRLEYDPAFAPDDHRGRYGRLLAYVWVLGKEGQPLYMMNEEMLRLGMAEVTDFEPYRYLRRFRLASGSAKIGCRGLFACGGGSATDSTDEKPEPAA